jgi:AcrR family transcriptional regulator
VPPSRLPKARRRDHLLDAAAQLIVSAGVEAVSMEAVADRAGVSRPLVYKHFGNRTEMLIDLYRRENSLMYIELSAAVRAAPTLEQMYRSLVRAALHATNERGALFQALRSAGAWNRELRHEERARDQRAVQLFADHAATEYGIPPAEAQAATMMSLTALDSVLAQWRASRTSATEELVEETYLDLVTGGMDRIAARTAAIPARRVNSGVGRR